MRSFILAGFAAAIATLLSSASVWADGDSATVVTNSGSFSGCQAFTDVGLLVCGTASDIEYHLVFTPSGNENSWFKVENFTGTVTQLCPTFPACASLPFSHESGMVLVHLGPNRPDFILVNHPSPAPLPHRVDMP